MDDRSNDPWPEGVPPRSIPTQPTAQTARSWGMPPQRTNSPEGSDQ